MGWRWDVAAWTIDAQRRSDRQRPVERDRFGLRADPVWVAWAAAAACTWSVLGLMVGFAANCVAHMSLVRLPFPIVVELLDLLRCHWATDGSVGVCLSAMKNKGGGPRVPLASRQRSIRRLSSLIWPECGVPEGSVGLP
jgi:hypothetical protein